MPLEPDQSLWATPIEALQAMQRARQNSVSTRSPIMISEDEQKRSWISGKFTQVYVLLVLVFTLVLAAIAVSVVTLLRLTEVKNNFEALRTDANHMFNQATKGIGEDPALRSQLQAKMAAAGVPAGMDPTQLAQLAAAAQQANAPPTPNNLGPPVNVVVAPQQQQMAASLDEPSGAAEPPPTTIPKRGQRGNREEVFFPVKDAEQVKAPSETPIVAQPPAPIQNSAMVPPDPFLKELAPFTDLDGVKKSKHS